MSNSKDDAAAQHFADGSQKTSEHWRSIILFGRNVASYKFALAKSLLEISDGARDLVSLEELATPFARNICEHLSLVDRQGTFERSTFLDACRFRNRGQISEDELRDSTVALGFNNVVDAFHVVGSGEVPTRFFVDERSLNGGIRLTDAMHELALSEVACDLNSEVEARWRLVEEAWDRKAQGEPVVVLYDSPQELLIPALLGKRRPIAGIRPALNGYQKGHCFYCFAPIGVTRTELLSDVDHFLPHSLMSRGLPFNLDSPWNLVLACRECNRGTSGKFAMLPDHHYLARLHRRNEFLIGSNHPLRETLILHTGQSGKERAKFLSDSWTLAASISSGKHSWSAPEVENAVF